MCTCYTFGSFKVPLTVAAQKFMLLSTKLVMD